jgi:hypothetical protein
MVTKRAPQDGGTDGQMPLESFYYLSLSAGANKSLCKFGDNEYHNMM